MTSNARFNIQRQSKDRLLQLLRASSFAARINVEAVERTLDETRGEVFSLYFFEEADLPLVVILTHEDAPRA